MSHYQDLEQIKSLAGNDKCFECAKDNPSWCSVDFGVVICQSCSDIHRSLVCNTNKTKAIMLRTKPIPCVITLSFSSVLL